MIHGKKYFNKDVGYVTFTRHYCPQCNNKLKTVKISKIINSKSSEAKDFNFYFGGAPHGIHVTGDVKFIWKEFKCPNCDMHFTVEELKKIEGIEINEDRSNEQTSKKRNDLKSVIVFFVIGFIVSIIIYFLKCF